MTKSKRELSKDERNAINTLKRLAKRWPKTLWLFSGSGTMSVLKVNANGEHAMTIGGCVDQDYVVESRIGIPNDGGDW